MRKVMNWLKKKLNNERKAVQFIKSLILRAKKALTSNTRYAIRYILSQNHQCKKRYWWIYFSIQHTKCSINRNNDWHQNSNRLNYTFRKLNRLILQTALKATRHINHCTNDLVSWIKCSNSFPTLAIHFPHNFSSFTKINHVKTFWINFNFKLSWTIYFTCDKNGDWRLATGDCEAWDTKINIIATIANGITRPNLEMFA